MFGPALLKVADFVKKYMTRILRAPLVIEDESVWWRSVFTSASQSWLEVPPDTPPLSSESEAHIRNVIKLWFAGGS